MNYEILRLSTGKLQFEISKKHWVIKIYFKIWNYFNK